MNKPSLSDRLRYAFDNLMARGTVAQVGLLALVTVLVTLAVTLVVWFTRIAAEGSFVEQFWSYLMTTLDADAMSGDPWTFRLAGLIVSFTGVFVTSILVGLLATGIGNKIEDLRKGRSRVVESGHTVILGWSAQVFPIVSELLVANENRRRACIAILGDHDKVEMEDEIRDRIGNGGNTRIVCRSGNPMEMGDLAIVSLRTARSVIVLAPEGDDPDSAVIKTLLAITRAPSRRKEAHHVVTEIHNPSNAQVARIAGEGEVEIIQTGRLIARIMAQTCRQSGLSVVYQELLDFGGDEIYFQEEPALAGRTFGEALLAYEDSAVLGLRQRDGRLKLNPPMETRIGERDEVIAISEDDDTVRLSGLEELGIEQGAIRTAAPAAPRPERVLILGWNWRAPDIVNELDNYVAPGSMCLVVADCEGGEADLGRRCTGVRNLAVSFRRADTTDRPTLDGLACETFGQVIVLSCSDTLDPQQADARTLITLLHLRDIGDHAGSHFSIVSEMLDMRNRDLAEVARADDFVVSDRLVSLILSQISENKALGAVFEDLFDPDGSEIYLKPAGDYVSTGEPVTFYTVVEAARRRGEVALGYRLVAHADDAGKSYGVVVNPAKSEAVTFAAGDRVIVLAEG